MENQSYDLTNSIQMYMDDISDIPLLSAEEEKALAFLASNGDQEARNTLCEHNLRLVINVAKEYMNSNLTLLDLIQEGNIGLLKAIDKYDTTKGYRLSTYATWWIKQAITRYISDHSSPIRLPVYIREQIYKVTKAERELVQEIGREPTVYEISERTKLPPDKIEELKLAALDPISLEMPVGEDKDTTIADYVEDTSDTSQRDIEKMLTKSTLDELMKILSEKERRILSMRYGLDDGRPMTLEEIGQVYGVTRERIRQIEVKAIRRLRTRKRQVTL